MVKIIPNLWFASEAKEAAVLYTSIFDDSRILSTTVLHDTPSGTAEIISIELAGQEFMLLSAGPLFQFNPSVSFLVALRSVEEVDALWRELAPGSKALMELGAYPFSERYGWLEDKYGLSWQLIYVGDRAVGQTIVPMLLFVGDVCGKAEEAINFYAKVFKNSSIGEIDRHGAGEEPDAAGTVKQAVFTLENLQFRAMDSAWSHEFAFNEAISFIVHCDTQSEIDYYWERLSARPEAEQCGWLKDQYGLSWQIVPAELGAMLRDGDEGNGRQVTAALLEMKKLDLEALRRAYRAG